MTDLKDLREQLQALADGLAEDFENARFARHLNGGRPRDDEPEAIGVTLWEDHRAVELLREALTALSAPAPSVERLRAALVEYGTHDPQCVVQINFREPCNCGFHDVLSSVEPGIDCPRHGRYGHVGSCPECEFLAPSPEGAQPKLSAYHRDAAERFMRCTVPVPLDPAEQLPDPDYFSEASPEGEQKTDDGALPDSVLLEFWRAVSGPYAQLTGPLIRFAGLIRRGTQKCPQPPKGWECSRPAGHDGPCAASPTPETITALWSQAIVQAAEEQRSEPHVFAELLLGRAQEPPPQSEQSEDTEVVNALSAAMREADRVFEKVGGSTRHHVRDCLLPVLNRNGWRVVRCSR